MTKYTVIDNFRWGGLFLDKGQTLVIESNDKQTVQVTIEHDSASPAQIVSAKAVDTMVMLKKIEKKL